MAEPGRRARLPLLAIEARLGPRIEDLLALNSIAAFTSSISRTSSAFRRVVKCRSWRGAGVPGSMGRSSARHFTSPPFSTTTSSWPITRKFHHTRGALNRPLLS